MSKDQSESTSKNTPKSTPRTAKWFGENKVERVQAFINPKTEPELLEAYLFLVEHYKGKKEALAHALMNEYKKVKEESESE
jgi:hypothetical protein